MSDYSPLAASTGFVFDSYTPDAVLKALTRAIRLHAVAPGWRGFQLNGMRQDHSWDRSAREYVRIYECASGTGVGVVQRGARGPLRRHDGG